MGRTYQAVVWTAPQRVEIAERPIPVPERGEVLLQVKAAGICGTDLHIISGHHPQARPPLVPGHELSGVIVGLGAEVDPSLLNAAVGADSYRGCGRCDYCRTGRAQLCSGGTCEYGVNIDGGWAEYVVLPAANIYRLPERVSFLEAGAGCILNCPLAAVERVDVHAGEDVLVIGDGPSSLVMVQLVRLKGARKVVISGHRPRRLAQARELGVDRAVKADEEDLPAVLRSMAVIPQVVIDAVGTSESFSAALRAAGPEGRVHLFGLPEGPFNGVPMELLLFKELRISSSTGAPRFWPAAMTLIEHGLLKVAQLITHRFDLRRAPEALALLREDRQQVIKAVFVASAEGGGK